MASKLDKCNARALYKRTTLPDDNNFPMVKLSKLPPYMGWVDCADGKFVMFLGGNDDGVALRYFWNGHYEKTTTALWAKLAQQARFILDIGAHTGSFSLLARASNPNARIIAIEPYILNYSRLLLNIRGNNFDDIKTYMVAAAAKSGTAEFAINTEPNFLTSGGKLGDEGKHLFRVETIIIDELLNDAAKSTLDLIKIDVEGAEPQVVSGMGDILAKANPVIFFESISDKSVAALEVVFRKHGFRFFEIDDESGDINEVDKLVVSVDADGKMLKKLINRIAVRESNPHFQTIKQNRPI